jgi:hypothetical protein
MVLMKLRRGIKQASGSLSRTSAMRRLVSSWVTDHQQIPAVDFFAFCHRNTESCNDGIFQVAGLHALKTLSGVYQALIAMIM